jgi:hypothetical protein
MTLSHGAIQCVFMESINYLEDISLLAFPGPPRYGPVFLRPRHLISQKIQVIRHSWNTYRRPTVLRSQQLLSFKPYTLVLHFIEQNPVNCKGKFQSLWLERAFLLISIIYEDTGALHLD